MLFLHDKKGGDFMEYIFSDSILETVNDTPTSLYGLYSIKRKLNGRTTIDVFFADEKFKSEEDVQGKYHDFYFIHGYYRDTDEYLDGCLGTVEDAMCEEDEYIDGRISAVEDAICELDEMLNGGK
jgi:hypothetical protein